MTAIVWFRRDLRIHDHPALRAAVDSDERVVPVFCLDPRLLRGRHASGSRTQFMLECLAELDAALRERGSGLVVRAGVPERELPALAADVGASSVHFSADASGFARRRDLAVHRALQGAGVRPALHPGMFAVDDLSALVTAAGSRYTVFTPFHRAWLRQPRRALASTPRALPGLPSRLRKGRLPKLADLALERPCLEAAPGGEVAARRLMSEWCRGAVCLYEDGRNALHGGSVSRLSPYLHFGCISPRELEERLPAGGGAEAYRRQLAWRDFYAYVLRHFPDNARREHQERYRGTIRWSRSERHFEAWCDGQTGYPVVDAAMRQLAREGWMHNRARLVVGSFLTKDLGIDWRRGERHFMRLLIDGDQASNNGNWQWIASVGVDPQPVARRIFNPVLQQQRYDPDGTYVRRYVKELAEVPAEFLAEPWRMPIPLQQRVGCVIGRDYPAPIVDHPQARREALARYGVARV